MHERDGEQGTGPADAASGDAPGERPGIEAAARLGAELAARGAPPGEGESAREAAWAEVVGPARAGWYVGRFRRFEARGGAYAFTWNWVCAFFPLLWLLYRKMYGWAAALVLADLLLLPATFAAPGLSILVSMGVMLALPAAGNWLYYRHVNGILARAAALPGAEAERRAYRVGAGGVSWAGPIAVVGLSVLAGLLTVSGAGPG